MYHICISLFFNISFIITKNHVAIFFVRKSSFQISLFNGLIQREQVIQFGTYSPTKQYTYVSLNHGSLHLVIVVVFSTTNNAFDNIFQIIQTIICSIHFSMYSNALVKIGYIFALVKNQIFVFTKIHSGEAGGGFILKTVI